MRGVIRFGLLILLVAALAGLAGATPACTGVVTLISQLVNNGDVFNNLDSGFACSSGGLTFSNFGVEAKTGFTSTNLTVTLNLNSAPSLDFGMNITQSAGQDVELEYEITPGISGMTASSGPGGGYNELVCTTAVAFSGGSAGACTGVTLAQFSVGGGSVVTHLWNGAANNWVFKDINGVSEFVQTPVPEPMTLSLMGAGFLGLGFLRRYRKP